MPKKATIHVVGPIGKFTTIENGQPVTTEGMQLVQLSRQITRLDPEVKDVTIEVSGMGGSVPTAKAMRAMIKSYAGRYNFTTKQIGDIASAHTIVFSAAATRLAAKGINPETGKKFGFLVHNPWIGHTSGDADSLQADAEDLRLTEDELIAIYQEDTGIDAEAIGPLMKVESVFDADQAVDLGFATGTYTALNQAAYKSNTMADKKKTNTLAQRVLAALGLTETGDKIVATAPPAELMGKPVMVDGQAAVDGIYTVVGGVITQLAEAPAGQAPAAAAPGAAPAAAKPAAVGMTRDEIVALIQEATGTKDGKKKKAATAAAAKDEDDEDDDQEDPIVKLATILNGAIDTKIDGIKKSLRTTHVPIGFKPENKVQDAKEWDRSFKANEHVAMRRDEPEKWARLFYSKYGRLPS